MPIYEYQREDGSIFEIVQKITEDPLEECPTTGQKVKRLMSRSAFHLKGGGWYKTDYAASASTSKADETKKDTDSSASSSESKSDSTTSADSSSTDTSKTTSSD